MRLCCTRRVAVEETSRPAARSAAVRTVRLLRGGTEGNERLTALTGAFLLGLLAVGPGGGMILGLHKASFVVWLVAFGIHVLAYALRTPALVAADWGRANGTAGAAVRYGAVALALVVGLIIAVAALPAAHPWLQ